MDAFTLVAKLILDKGEFDGSLQAVQSGLDSEENRSAWSKWGAAMGQVAGRAIEKVLRASVNFARSIIETGMDFDVAMSYVQSIGQMTDEQLEQVRTRAMELGASTQFTAEQVGQAFGYMALAGWKTDEMLAGIDGVLALAAASGEDLGRVSDIVTDALTAFGLEASDAGHFVDVLAQASAHSNTTVAQMGEAFKYLATTGGILGYTIDDVAVALGVLANNGTKGSMAGTAMRKILQTLISPTEDAAKAMEALGISLFEFGSDKRKPLMQVMQEMRDAFKESGFDLEGQDKEKALEEWAAYYDEWQKRVDEIEKKYENKDITKKMYSAEMDKLEEEFNDNMMRILYPNERFLQYAASIGGARGLGALLAIMKSTEGDFGDLADSVANSEDAAQTMAETMIDNLRGDITLMNSAMDGLKILISDEFKGSFREFVQMITAGIGDMSEAFSEGGLAGMFTNLADWVINGLTGALSDKSVTGKGAEDFGRALGDFVGHLISTLITNAPQILSGLFDAGMNLATGLLEGLFAGLFGYGEGTVQNFIADVQGEERDAITEAEANATKATGIVGYMDTLIEKYGEAATGTSEWQSALAELEKIMPGITDQIKGQADSASAAASAIREYIAGNKELAIEQAKEAALKQYQDKYNASVEELGKAEIDAAIAQAQADAARDQLIRYAAAEQVRGRMRDEYDTLEDEYASQEQKDAAQEAINAAMQEQIANWIKSFAEDPTMANASLSNVIAKAMIGDESGLIEKTWQVYEQQTAAAEANRSQIEGLTAAANALKQELALAEAAFAHAASEMNSVTAPDFSLPGVEGSHAKGLNYVPYDNYVASLHRGEMVLNQNQAREYRQGSGFDADMMYQIVAEAVASAVADIQINMDGAAVGNAVTKQVSRNIYQAQYARRYTTV